MKGKVGLFSFEWEKSAGGYTIEKHPRFQEQEAIVSQSNRRFPPPPPPLFDDTSGRVDKVIREHDGKRCKYKVAEIPYDIPKQFSHILSKDKKFLNEKRTLQFAQNYGLLGLISFGKKPLPYESFDQWRLIAQDFRRIYDLYDNKKESLDIGRAISLFNGSPTTIQLKPMLTWDTHKSLRSIYFKPTTLIGMMYLMLAEHMAGNTGSQKCKNLNCPRWFFPRSNKKFCSDSCRVSTHKKRKKVHS